MAFILHVLSLVTLLRVRSLLLCTCTLLGYPAVVQDGDAVHRAASGQVVCASVVLRAGVAPQRDRAQLPPHAALVLRLAQQREQRREQVVRVRRRQAENLARERFVYVQVWVAEHRVRCHDGMHGAAGSRQAERPDEAMKISYGMVPSCWQRQDLAACSRQAKRPDQARKM